MSLFGIFSDSHTGCCPVNYGGKAQGMLKIAVAVKKTPADLIKQPCCVCKEEKTARDDCMLFSKSDDPTQECKSMIDQYKSCMAGFGFKV
ncbi:hypothetical protein EYZ11_002053 [Aspergillus tanneri]|uniref:Cytochrome c oxidase copper chaperone n=1 Tax=Aspergillus tanneri TaxID=1220188 RepID=A0A4S3JTF1_9EURO|nr:hypothetical protein EYZ11_002053 [Aspergillus tanneri]